MSLDSGSQLGSYEILAPLGAGGMGEVYRARDTKLGREVAIKVLPSQLAEGAERLERFEREAKALAALNHPHVATLYGMERHDGVPFLAMELVEGPTLADRIAQGPMSPRRCASSSGRSPRDSRPPTSAASCTAISSPANIKLGSDESGDVARAKILDFGLAKALEAPGTPSAADLSDSPTMTLGATAHGVILGTAAYMAPEQARGWAVDKRADIWAFGVCLWEALTGERLFAEDDAPATLAAVLRDEPDVGTLAPQVPLSLRQLLARCLEKDPRRRLRDIGEARIALDSELEPPQPAVAPPARSPLSTAAPWLLSALLLGGLAWSLSRDTGASPTASRGPSQFSLKLPTDETVAIHQGETLAFSPDGRSLLLRTGPAGSNGKLFLRHFDQPEFTPIAGVSGHSYDAFFDPSGARIYFVQNTGTELHSVPVQGGASTLTARLPGSMRGGAVLPDGRIAFGITSGGLHALSADGTIETITDTAGNEQGEWHSYPDLSPEADRLLYVVVEGQTVTLWIRDLQRGQSHLLSPVGSRAHFVGSDLVVFSRREGTLWAAQLDDDRTSFAHEPVLVRDDVDYQGGLVQYTVSDDGTLAYFRAPAEQMSRRLVRVDRKGDSEPLPLQLEGRYSGVRWSPDGGKVAYIDSFDIYVADLARGARTRLTRERSAQSMLWSTDGAHILYERLDAVARIPSSGAGEPEIVFDRPASPLSWAPDGSLLLRVREEDGTIGITALPENGGEQAPLVSRAVEAAVSPDGRFVVYESTESSPSGIFLRPYPDVGTERWQVSTNRRRLLAHLGTALGRGLLSDHRRRRDARPRDGTRRSADTGSSGAPVHRAVRDRHRPAVRPVRRRRALSLHRDPRQDRARAERRARLGRRGAAAGRRGSAVVVGRLRRSVPRIRLPSRRLRDHRSARRGRHG